MTDDAFAAPIRRSAPRRNGMEIFFFLGVLALWIILQVWVLPKLGVPT
jgi:hypothetical protein